MHSEDARSAGQHGAAGGTEPGRWAELADLLRNRRKLLILTHNNPDPDSIGAAAGLKYLANKSLGTRSTIAHAGIIGRAENRAMVRHCRIDLRNISEVKTSDFSMVAIVDSQPGARNNMLSRRLRAQIAIDHHLPRRRESGKIPFADIRGDFGSTCTIMTSYFREAGVTPDRRTATALYYAILTDIGDIGRDRHPIDITALEWLHPHISERLLIKITHPRMPADYFTLMAKAIETAVIHRDVVVSEPGEVENPDMISELSDFLLQLEGMKWSMVCGSHGGRVLFSIRTVGRSRNAGQIAYRLSRGRGSAGGHKRFAGGMLSPGQPQAQEETCSSIKSHFLRLIERDDVAGRPLSRPAWRSGQQRDDTENEK